uniref:CAPSID PROTEIN n=1 Tax=Rabbit picobirnavirus TaxID=104395 RepID=UPI0001889A8A|nr:Chain A, Capsid Protein [Rabbit picobirnavirus]2VF1_B Chain B, Capsid Protein [Rabbit picobirnavirus]
DWSWYAPSELVAKQIANVPFNVLAGTPIKASVHLRYDPSLVSGLKDQLFVGNNASIMGARLLYLPSFGISTTVLDGLSMAANQLYAYVRKSNSGAKVYEAPDLMMTVLAIQEAYRVLFEIRRAITFANYWNFWNKYLPKQVFEQLLAIDFDDLMSNKANYCAQFNLMAQKINTFALPKYFKSILRMAYVSSNIFMDSDAVTGQMYAFVSSGYYRYSATTSESGTSLVYRDWPVGAAMPRKLNRLFTVLRELLDAIYGDADAQTMFGDIYKAFGSDGLYSIAEISVDETSTPVFDVDILAQIENCTILEANAGLAWTLDSCNVTQSKGQVLLWQPTGTITSSDNTEHIAGDIAVALGDRVLNSHIMEPQYSDVLEWTRLMATIEFDKASVTSSEKVTFKVTSCGAELIRNVLYFKNVWNDAAEDASQRVITYFSHFSQITVTNATDDPTSAYGLMSNTLDFTQLDWHPIIYVTETSVHNVANLNSILIGGDLKRPTVITTDVVKRINSAANYALYYSANLLSNIST